MNPASQSGDGTANLVTSAILWLEHDCHARAGAIEYRSLVAIFLCLSYPLHEFILFICNDLTERISFLRKSFTIGTFSGPLGFLRYDSICDELQL